MADERTPWDQQDGESNRWFQRFNAYRLMGPSRSLLGAVNKEREAKGLGRQNRAPGAWWRAFDQWTWKARADAWDRHNTEQADARWREQIMGEAELLARLSQMARSNIGEFVELGPDGHVRSIQQSALDERGHLVKKISSSKGKTNSIGIELYDAQGAMQMIGRHLKLFGHEERDNAGSGQRTFSLPAELLAPPFLNAYRDIKNQRHTEYLFFGGRGSTKSSFISLVTIYLLKNNPRMHAIAVRQVGETLRDSVYSQLLWAIGELGLEDEFKATTSPLEITHLPTGQKIYFRGADDPGKIKSIKPPFGYIGILWFEELDQFRGEEAIRKIEQSVIRGGDVAFIFKSFNPPRTAGNWANRYAKVPKATQYQHHSTYLDVPVEWLGTTFINEAEHLKSVNPGAYEHEYLGIANSAGGLVFENVTLRKITDEEITQFDRILHGQDWGFYPDPAHYVKMHYDAARLTLYIFGELRRYKTSNRALYDALVEYGLTPNDLLIADSAEPKSVADFREYGANCKGAEKGPESVKYSMKWLQSLQSIVIDPERAPTAAEEFLSYEYERDKDDNVISEYPDRNNHSIDAVRYGTNLIWRRRGQ